MEPISYLAIVTPYRGSLMLETTARWVRANNPVDAILTVVPEASVDDVDTHCGVYTIHLEHIHVQVTDPEWVDPFLPDYLDY